MRTVIIKSENLKALREEEKRKSRMRTYETDDQFKIGFEPGGDGFGHVSEDVNPEDVDLSSFKLKDSLHPKFWRNGVLDSRVRLKLLDIADDFMEFLGTPWADYDDIIMTGSLANYNWSSEYSDIDLHIVMDYKDIDEKIDLVERFLKSQTILWNGEHEDMKICGFPVEIYVQDKNAELKAGGVYSLERNEWIKEPEEDDLSDESINRRWVQRRAASYMDRIDSVEEKVRKHKKDSFFLEKMNIKLDKIFKEIKKDREEGFKKGGEMNDKNIVFKTLRRQGYIGKIKDMQKYIYNIVNSL